MYDVVYVRFPPSTLVDDELGRPTVLAAARTSVATVVKWNAKILTTRLLVSTFNISSARSAQDCLQLVSPPPFRLRLVGIATVQSQLLF